VMRPQSVWVWLVDELPWAAAALADDAADAAVVGLDTLGCVDAPADEQAARASDAISARPIARRSVVAWRRWAVMGPSYPWPRRVRT